MKNHLRHVQTDGGNEFQNGPIVCQNLIATQSTILSDANSSETRLVFPIRAFHGCPIMDPILGPGSSITFLQRGMYQVSFCSFSSLRILLFSALKFKSNFFKLEFRYKTIALSRSLFWTHCWAWVGFQLWRPKLVHNACTLKMVYKR